MLYCTGSVRFACLGGGNECTYQTACEGIELVASVEILLSEKVYKSEPTIERDGHPDLPLKLVIRYHAVSVIYRIVSRASNSS